VAEGPHRKRVSMPLRASENPAGSLKSRNAVSVSNPNFSKAFSASLVAAVKGIPFSCKALDKGKPIFPVDAVTKIFDVFIAMVVLFLRFNNSLTGIQVKKFMVQKKRVYLHPPIQKQGSMLTLNDFAISEKLPDRTKIRDLHQINL